MPAVRAVFVPAPTAALPPRVADAIAEAAPLLLPEVVDATQVEARSWGTRVDGPAFAAAIERASQAMAAEGYALVSVTPVLRGVAQTLERQGAATHVDVAGIRTIAGGYGTGWGYGYPVTDGVVLVGVRP